MLATGGADAQQLAAPAPPTRPAQGAPPAPPAAAPRTPPDNGLGSLDRAYDDIGNAHAFNGGSQYVTIAKSQYSSALAR